VPGGEGAGGEAALAAVIAGTGIRHRRLEDATRELVHGRASALQEHRPGSSWQKISGDLTLGSQPRYLKMMGSVVGTDALSRHDGQSNYGSLTSIGESLVDPLLIYTGATTVRCSVPGTAERPGRTSREIFRGYRHRHT
jgi:hypothetical protein